MDSVPETMKSITSQLSKKLKANKDIIGWNEQGQMVFKETTIPGTNIVDLVVSEAAILVIGSISSQNPFSIST